jgi:hypothetical protein
MRFYAGLDARQQRAARSARGLPFQWVAPPFRRVLLRRPRWAESEIDPALEDAPSIFRVQDYRATTSGRGGGPGVASLLFSLEPVSQPPGPSLRVSQILSLPHKPPSGQPQGTR